MPFEELDDDKQPQEPTLPNNQQDDEEQPRHAAASAAEDELAYELARLKRLGMFSTFLAILMISFMFLPFFYSILLLVAGFWYAFSPCLVVLVRTATLLATESDNNKPLESSMLNHATDIHHDTTVEFGFDETRQDIRCCELPRPQQGGPPAAGVYKVVYAAECFGRVLRTEGELWLRFTERPNGWDITGQSRSAATTGQTASRIRDGYLNAKGEMYWLVDGGSGKTSGGKLIQYRGQYELNTNELHDGDFLSKDGTLQGRIVRLYLSKETEVELLEEALAATEAQQTLTAMGAQDWGTTDIEMVAKSQIS